MSNKKVCSRCSVPKPLSLFHRQRTGKLGRHSWCKDCFNTYQKPRTKKRSPALRKADNLKARYGLNVSDVEQMLAAQQSACAICAKPLTMETKKVDHCHTTNRVRGLLCHRCNLFCGALDDTRFREAAFKYLGISQPLSGGVR